jgi:hypothetical protein
MNREPYTPKSRDDGANGEGGVKDIEEGEDEEVEATQTL